MLCGCPHVCLVEDADYLRSTRIHHLKLRACCVVMASQASSPPQPARRVPNEKCCRRCILVVMPLGVVGSGLDLYVMQCKLADTACHRAEGPDYAAHTHAQSSVMQAMMSCRSDDLGCHLAGCSSASSSMTEASQASKQRIQPCIAPHAAYPKHNFLSACVGASPQSSS